MMWPVQSPAEKAGVEGLMLKGAGDRLYRYFQEKLRFDTRGLSLTPEEYAYYWNG